MKSRTMKVIMIYKKLMDIDDCNWVDLIIEFSLIITAVSDLSEFRSIICFLKTLNLRLTFAQSSLTLYSIYTQLSLNSCSFCFVTFSRARPPPIWSVFCGAYFVSELQAGRKLSR